MAYNIIEICVFTLFLHSFLLTPCMTQSGSATTSNTIETSTLTTSPKTSTEKLSNKSPSTPPQTVDQPPQTNGICPLFNSTADAYSLKNAMEGFGTDEFTIIHLLSMRSNSQMQQIRKNFTDIFKKDLITELKSELSGNLRTTVVGLLLTSQQFYAKELNDAIVGLGTDNKIIAEILGSLSSSEIKHISDVYKKEYSKTLKTDIADDTSGSFRKLLEKLCDATRADDNEVIVTENVTDDTHKLILAGFDSQLKHTNDEEEALIEILSNRSYPHLREVFKKYNELKRKPISNVIKGRFSSTLEHTFSVIIQRANSKYEYYAQQLEDAMDGIGTDNHQLINIIVGRLENDLDKIKKSYENKFGSPLIDRVSAETSGTFRNILMALLRK